MLSGNALAMSNKKIFIASKPVDFRMSIDGLANLITTDKQTNIHDGSIYVFYNQLKNKINCLFWDNNGFVLYYKRLDNTKFKFMNITRDSQSISGEELDIILSGFDPTKIKKLTKED